MVVVVIVVVKGVVNKVVKGVDVVVVVDIGVFILVSSFPHLHIGILFCLTHSPYGYQLTRQ